MHICWAELCWLLKENSLKISRGIFCLVSCVLFTLISLGINLSLYNSGSLPAFHLVSLHVLQPGNSLKAINWDNYRTYLIYFQIIEITVLNSLMFQRSLIYLSIFFQVTENSMSFHSILIERNNLKTYLSMQICWTFRIHNLH